MAKESYIERLQREKKEFITYVSSINRWRATVEVLNNTGRKGSALQEVIKAEKEMDDLYKTIEPYMAE